MRQLQESMDVSPAAGRTDPGQGVAVADPKLEATAGIPATAKAVAALPDPASLETFRAPDHQVVEAALLEAGFRPDINVGTMTRLRSLEKQGPELLDPSAKDLPARVVKEAVHSRGDDWYVVVSDPYENGGALPGGGRENLIATDAKTLLDRLDDYRDAAVMLTDDSRFFPQRANGGGYHVVYEQTCDPKTTKNGDKLRIWGSPMVYDEMREAVEAATKFEKRKGEFDPKGWVLIYNK